MGKKRIRKGKMSKGSMNTISKIGKHEITAVDYEINLLQAWEDGKNPWVRYQNPEPHTNRPILKKKANDLWGNPKNRVYNIFTGLKKA